VENRALQPISSNIFVCVREFLWPHPLDGTSGFDENARTNMELHLFGHRRRSLLLLVKIWSTYYAPTFIGFCFGGLGGVCELLLILLV
jgi:hypothetical protein